MKFPTYKAQEAELEILKHWKTHKITESLRIRNENGPKFYFLEGPPYTSGRVHVGTAWQTSMKDIVLRYKRMQKFNVWDRMGYDMHGLPTEQKVMAKLDLKNKEDIEKYGLKKFTDECEKFCSEMMHKMNEDFIRLGITMDFSDPYQPIKKEFMEGEWWLIKRAHEKGRLYQGLRTMHWDAATQTAVAKHEIEYKSVKDTSIYVKFPLKNKRKTFFIIWTTTPWTIPLNLAIMANPDLTYAEVAVNGETWIMTEALVKSVMTKAKITEYQIKNTYVGKMIEGQEYEHPLNIKSNLPKELQHNKRLFTVLLTTEYVDASTGTGLVHCAPGCGPEDYEVGHLHHIPPFNCVNEEGFFENFGDFTGLKAKSDDPKFIAAIKAADALIAKESYVHDYPHGERSHEPIIFRTTKQWFFKVEDLKEKMLKANEDINWNPIAAKNGFNAWLENLRDNSITKQRYWGTPVPIWQAPDGDYLVVGCIAELEELSGQKITNMHIPDIDKIIIEKDGKVYKRVPDVLDVWIDAGTASWNCLDFPKNKELFEKFFPADFILEGKDQIRGWFNLLMIASFLAFDKPAFKNVYMNGFVTDVNGVKMSKSLGNIISPYELIDKYGADVLRYYMFQTNAGEDINFSWDECAIKSRYLTIMWNVHKLLLNLAEENKINPFTLNSEIIHNVMDSEERYIISKLHSAIETVTALLETYRLDEIIAPIEDLYLELSRTYIQMVREKSSQGEDQDKEVCAYTIAHVLLETLKMFHLVAPFMTEAIYLNLKDAFNLQEESLSHFNWPKADHAKINKDLERDFEITKSVIQAALGAREKAQLGVRWPVKEIIVVSKNRDTITAVGKLRDIIKKQTNTKSISVLDSLPGMKFKIRPDYSKIGPVYAEHSPQIITKLTIDSPQTILTHFEREGVYRFELDGRSVEIKPEMVLIEREVPAGFIESEAKGGFVYLDTHRTQDLEAEGFAREVARNIQEIRKKSGLQKLERIALYLKTSETLKPLLDSFKVDMAEKVGAEKFDVGSVDPLRKHQIHIDFKVKQESFTVCFDKL